MLNVINFWGEPSCGKSTTAAGLFFLMKHAGCSVELVTEVAKDLTWRKDKMSLKNQLQVFANQETRLFYLRDQVEFAIVDSPLPLSIVYSELYCNRNSEDFENLVMKTWHEYANFNVLIRRTRPYRTEGRNEDINQAEKIRLKVMEVLKRYSIPSDTIKGDELAPWGIFKILQKACPEPLGEILVPLLHQKMEL